MCMSVCVCVCAHVCAHLYVCVSIFVSPPTASQLEFIGLRPRNLVVKQTKPIE